jgi:hypothetical protein
MTIIGNKRLSRKPASALIEWRKTGMTFNTEAPSTGG